MKKKERDRKTPERYLSEVIEELGDLLWYIATIASRNGVKLSALAAPLIRSASIPRNNIRFEHLQRPPGRIMIQPSKWLEFRLVELGSTVGALVAAQTDSLHENGKPPNAAFTEVLKRVIEVASRVGISLDQVAQENLDKVHGRWPPRKAYPAPFDGGYPVYEQLPRHMVIDIEEVIPTPGQYFVLQTCNGLHVGDRLTDNIEDLDEYRFHDVFHYAYAAVLGWSPVLRSLLRLKRKSNKIVDETQDGARAILIEEGIAALVFNEAKRQDYFRDVTAGKLSFDLLKTIKAFVEGYEVSDLPLWLWEEAILQGFDAFRFLQDNRAGRVTIDYATHTLRVESMPRAVGAAAAAIPNIHKRPASRITETLRWIGRSLGIMRVSS
ncbi:MAG: pyrophosphatase [Sphingomicrobium sp.]